MKLFEIAHKSYLVRSPVAAAFAVSALLLVAFPKEVSASAFISLNTCDVGDVQITGISRQGDGESTPISLPGPISASACFGAVDDDRYPSAAFAGVEGNLGYEGEGFLNNKDLFPDYGAFVDSADDLFDLQGTGSKQDPGWIYVTKYDVDEGEYSPETVSDGSSTYQFTDGILDISINESGTSGTFSYRPPATNPGELLDIIGADRFFNEAAIVFKGANQFVVYNFKLSDLTQLAGVEPVTGTEAFNYEFTGTWDLGNVLSTPNGNSTPGLSHVLFALKDPTAPSVSVPTPSTLLLLGTFMLGLCGWRRLGAKKSR